MLPAVESALLQLGNDVPDEEKSAISDLLAAARKARSEKSASRLKSALAALDEATQSLATRLLEKALAKTP